MPHSNFVFCISNDGTIITYSAPGKFGVRDFEEFLEQQKVESFESMEEM